MKISIISLIYKSTKYLQFVYDQVMKHTNMLDCEFYFVANDAEEPVLKYLKEKQIPHYVYQNTPENIKAHGVTEFYVNNVYRAYNFGASKAQGKYLLFVNSDMAFSPHWMDNLFKHFDEDRMCVTSRLLESGRYKSGLHGLTFDAGKFLQSFNENKFLAKAKEISKPELHPGGLYMPLLITKSVFESVGGYPEGNLTVDCVDIFNPTIAKKGKPSVPGDAVFMKKLATINVEHFTAFDSIVYHFQNGEMFEHK